MTCCSKMYPMNLVGFSAGAVQSTSVSCYSHAASGIAGKKLQAPPQTSTELVHSHAIQQKAQHRKYNALACPCCLPRKHENMSKVLLNRMLRRLLKGLCQEQQQQSLRQGWGCEQQLKLPAAEQLLDPICDLIEGKPSSGHSWSGKTFMLQVPELV